MLLLSSNNNSTNTFLTEERKQVIIQLFKVAILRGLRVRILTSKNMQHQLKKTIERRRSTIMEKLGEGNYEQKKKGKENRGGSVGVLAQEKIEIRSIDKLQRATAFTN